MMKNASKVLLIAGNGFIGARTATSLAASGYQMAVVHTGRSAVLNLPGTSSILVAPTQLPIQTFPDAAFRFNADVVIHFMCMGEEDTRAFVEAFEGKAQRLVLISSCDVYRAYGRFIKTESGTPHTIPLTESSPLRNRLYPYRAKAKTPDQMQFWYDKIVAERIFQQAAQSERVILRLPKVYGAEKGHGLETVYGFAHRPDWRWTHGHVDNVGTAIGLAATHPDGADEVFNLGEETTPTMGERLAYLPPSPDIRPVKGEYDFRNSIDCDTSKIRRMLGWKDVVDEQEAMIALAER